MAAPDSGAAGAAIEIFAGWLSRRESGELVAFDELLRGHPHLAAELAELEATWRGFAAASDPSPSTLSLHERIKSRFGEGSVPKVSLREREKSEARGDSSSALIAQLSAHSTGFGRYRIRGEVARGGMGAILKIWDEDLRRHLAMKVILGQADVRASGTTPPVESSKVARFLEEAQVTGQLDHPGIVPVHELGLDPEGRVYFTMKLVKGSSLKEVFDLVAEGQGGWTQTRVLGVLLKVCEAMAYAHDKGVIHRDLKPGNIMVGKFGEVHVMDWGLARILDQPDEKDIRIREEIPRSSELRSHRDEHRGETPESPLYTMDGDVVGTPAYMPLEQAAGKANEVGPHSDVYALGAMLYHLLAGHMPYVPKGARLNNYAIWGLVQQGPPTSIAQLSPETPAELVSICEKAMARDWKQRYRDMSELAADLSAYLEHRVVGAYETGTWAETKKWVERNKPLAAALAAGVLALVAGLVVSLSLKEKADTNAELAEERRIEAERNEIAAKTNAAEAKRQEGIARTNERTAREQEALAKSEKANVLRLSAFQTLDDLTREAEELWPAEPRLDERYRAWLEKAEKLLAKIPEFRESLAEIEKRALPQGEEAPEAERMSHPRAEELEQERARLQWFSRMLGEEAWPSESSVEVELSKEALPAEANALNELAWPWVDPEKPVYGSEVKALLLARRAVGLASADAERAGPRDTLAWALFMLGRFDEALAEERRALEEAGEAKREEYAGYVAKLEAAAKRWQGEGRAERVKERDTLAPEATAVEAQVPERRDWRFAEEDDRWWHAQMEKLIAALSAFGDGQTGLAHGISPDHGWSVAKRLEFAALIEERSVKGPEAARLWTAAIEAIGESEKYRGAKWPSGGGLTPQLGLLPIGADRESGLWEFAHLQTGEPAERGADGKLMLKEEMGLVFVLIPGGMFWMGAQKTDPAKPNYDPQARGAESPVHEVMLSAYFLSKYEMTQRQWETFTGQNPSQYGPSTKIAGHFNLLHPVEQVTWTQCMEVMTRLGLSLPSEAQWEFGCRGGSDTAWWTGADRESLRGQVNLADQSAKKGGGNWADIQDWPDLEDGWVVHATVGSFPANPFGLHEVHGNVWEWCLDGFDGTPYGRDPVTDPVASPAGASNRVDRGGSYGDAAKRARSAHRDFGTPELLDNAYGLRPAAGVRPSASQLQPQPR